MPALLTAAQAAERLNISAKRVRLLLRAGKLPGVHIGRSWRIPEASLAAYLADLEARAGANLAGGAR